jgi:transposase InsO family protein
MAVLAVGALMATALPGSAQDIEPRAYSNAPVGAHRVRHDRLDEPQGAIAGTTRPPKASSEAQADLFEYIEVFYNRSRRHSTLGYSSPARFLQNWISKHAAQQSMAT